MPRWRVVIASFTSLLMPATKMCLGLAPSKYKLIGTLLSLECLSIAEIHLARDLTGQVGREVVEL